MAAPFDTAIPLLLARLLFGGVLAFTGLNHFLSTEEMAAYAGAKDVPSPTALVVLSGVLLVASGLGIIVGIFPFLAAVGSCVFFLVVTPVMHDFWEFEGEQRQNELNHFLKNVALLGGGLAFIALSSESWAYAANIGL